MKLLTRYSRINLVVIVTIFLVASAAYYFTLNYLFIHQVDEDLQIEEQEINSYVAKYNKLPEIIKVEDQVIAFYPAGNVLPGRHFTTVKMMDPVEKESRSEAFRQLQFGVAAGGRYYRATVSKSLEETVHLLHSLLLISLVTVLSILAASSLINRLVLKRIWKPFYATLARVKEFRLSSDQPLQLPPSGIDEFRFMNDTLERITQQTQAEYIALKTFSENASHEMQTPLAVIRSKLDLLIQDEHLTEQQSAILQGTYRSIQKLTRLNQSLLLLARIDNNQYEEKQVVDLKERLKEKEQEFQELWKAQGLSVTVDLQEAKVLMNPHLADILFNNLLSNATRYNVPGGQIHIHLSPKELRISNTGKAEALESERLYQRFYKSSDSTEQNGLGLSIIKQICDVSGFTVNYHFENGRHQFHIGLKQ